LKITALSKNNVILGDQAWLSQYDPEPAREPPMDKKLFSLPEEDKNVTF